MNKKLLGLSIIGLFFACTPAEQNGTLNVKNPKVPFARAKAVDTAVSDSQAPSDAEIPTVQADTSKDPITAKAVVDPNITFENSSVIPTAQVPIIKITSKESDFVKILRCPKSYVVTTPLGESVALLPHTDENLAQFSYAWSSAIDDHYKCKIISTHYFAPEVEDTTCPTGTFYYVLNPCIAKDNSTTGKDACSNRLVFTNSFQYVSVIREDILQKQQELSDAQADLNSILEELGYLAEASVRQLRACENAIAEDSALSTMRSGLLKLGLFAGGALFGGVLMPFSALRGPNSAVMIGAMGSQMGGAILSAKLGLGPIANTCLNDYSGLTAEDLKKLPPSSVAFIKSAQKTAPKYESLYGTAKLFKRITDILDVKKEGIPKSKDGPLQLAVQKLQAMNTQMQQMDSSVINIDKFYATNGIDPNNIAASVLPSE